MPHYNVITSANTNYWIQGAKINVLTWDRNLAPYFTIHVYSEDNLDKSGFSNRVIFHNLYEECPDLLKFIDTYKDDPHYNGTHLSNSVAYKWNGIKFAHKTFPIFKLAKSLKDGWLIWIDCDALMYKPVDKHFIDLVLPQSKAITYLGRKGRFSECGFVGYNLDVNPTRDFLHTFEDFYKSGKLSSLRETHDSFVFDQVMLTFENQSKFYNINDGAASDKHPFMQSLLKNYMAHAKGPSKIRIQKKYLKRWKMKDCYLELLKLLHENNV